jgi:hypothetical protein
VRILPSPVCYHVQHLNIRTWTFLTSGDLRAQSLRPRPFAEAAVPAGAGEQREPGNYARSLRQPDPSDSASPDSLAHSDPVKPTVQLVRQCRWVGGPGFAALLYRNEAQAN